MLALSTPNLDNLIFQRKTDILSTVLDSETVILNINSGVYNSLNDVGTHIWEVLAKPISFEELKKSILDSYDTVEKECTKDLIAFLNELLSANLVFCLNDNI